MWMDVYQGRRCVGSNEMRRSIAKGVRGMPCTQCVRNAHEVLDVDKYSNPSFGPFSQVLVPYQGFFLAF